MKPAFPRRSGALLLESQEKDGRWSTFASYRLRRLQHLPSAQGRPASQGPQ